MHGDPEDGPPDVTQVRGAAREAGGGGTGAGAQAQIMLIPWEWGESRVAIQLH